MSDAFLSSIPNTEQAWQPSTVFPISRGVILPSTVTFDSQSKEQEGGEEAKVRAPAGQVRRERNNAPDAGT
jgi:hypothetical protein